MKGKDTKNSKGTRQTQINSKSMNKGKSTAKQGKTIKKGAKKPVRKKEDRNCSNNAPEEPSQCREDEVYGGGGRLWNTDASSSLTLNEKQMLADQHR